MQFKHPEILYFLFLLVIPILVHLFQLRRFKKEYFSNVQFLKALSIQTRKSSKLKKWLLLITRLLIFSAIIFAFAQPFFKAKDSNNASNEMYLILDNSFSMQAKGQKGELLKRAVEDILEHAPENQIFSLITNSEIFYNTDIKSVRKELQNLKYSANAFDLENAMAQIKSRKSNYNKDVIIISDALGLDAKQLKSIDKLFATYFVIPKAEQKNNISIDSVFINQTLDQFYEIGVQLSNFSTNKTKISIALYNQEKLVAKTLIAFEKQQKKINFTIPKVDFNGYVSIVDDGLLYDNKFYFSISKPTKINVLSIGSIEKSVFLSKIYTASEFNYINSEIANLDYNSIDKQDAIVLNELIEIPQALQTTLKAFVEKGGNLILIPSDENVVSNINNTLSNFGNISFKTLENVEKRITKIAFNNPLYENVFEKKIANFQYPNVKRSFGVNSSNPAILSYEDQSIFLTSLQSQSGQIYVFAAPINKQNSNFQNSPLIVPTFYKMAQSAQKTGINAFMIGENLPLLVNVKLSKDEILTVKTDRQNVNQESFIPVQQFLNNKVKITFNDNPKDAGNFGIFKSDQLLKNVSFNYKRSESDLTIVNNKLLSEYKIIDTIETVFDTLQTDRTNSEMWKLFAVLTLLFLIIELFIQKFVK